MLPSGFPTPPCHFERSREISRRTVSCRYDTQSFHVGQETIRKQFPVAMLHNRPMPNRKLYANSFLSL